VELGKPFEFLERGRIIERKSQYQRVRECGESEGQQDESPREIITCWIESQWLTRKRADFHMVINTKENGKKNL
jgi:hypothetical protein